MAKYLHTIQSPSQTLTASADITPVDLPVNPLSFLLLRFALTRAAPAALDTYSALDDLLTQITSVRIAHLGEDIVNGSLRDLMVLNAVYQHAYPGWSRLDAASGAIDNVVFPICLGRRRYDPMSCFPATKRGNLRFFMTSGALGAGQTAVAWAMETLELIEATPEEYVKYVTNSRTSVAGQFDAPLPIGNPLLGILLFDTGLRDNTAATYSWGQVKLLVSSVEQYYSTSDIEMLAGALHSHLEGMPFWPGHVHQFDGAAVGLDKSDEADYDGAVNLKGYAYLDFDPLRDGNYQLETAGASDLLIRATGDEATAVRYLAIERVKKALTGAAA